MTNHDAKQVPEKLEGVFVGILAGILICAALLLASSLATVLQPPFPGEAERRQTIEQIATKPEDKANRKDTSPQPAPATVMTEKSEPERGPHENPANPHQNDSAFDKFWEAIANPVTYFTCVLMAVAILQWCLARSQASDARTRQRAWVVIERMDGNLRAEQPLPTTMTVSNSGETPAFIYRRIIEAFVCPRDTVDLSADISATATKLDASDEISMVLAPHGQKHTFNESHDNVIINDELRGRISYERGTDTIFLIGMILYRDTFGAAHTSTCCYRWNAAPHKNKWMGHIRHNTMT